MIYWRRYAESGMWRQIGKKEILNFSIYKFNSRNCTGVSVISPATGRNYGPIELKFGM